MQKTILMIIPFFIVGCGGGNGGLDKVDIGPLVKNKTFYEDNLCNNPEFRSYTITDNQLIVKSYNDSDFSDINSTKIYPVVDFDSKENEMIIKKDGERLNCAIGYEITDKSNIEMLELDCVNADNEKSATNLFTIAFETIEEALNNVNECK